jgi:hypothetical protein
MRAKFEKDLRYSEDQVNRDFWNSVYLKAFGDHSSTAITGCNAQNDGVDRVLTLPNQRMILVDEKVQRRHHTIVWDGEKQDSLWIEEYSVVEKKIPGWAMKPLRVEYILYGFPTAGRAHLLPVLQLQAAYKIYWQEWKQNNWWRLTKKESNDGYHTSGFTVPINVLKRAITDVMTIEVKQEEMKETEIIEEANMNLLQLSGAVEKGVSNVGSSDKLGEFLLRVEDKKWNKDTRTMEAGYAVIPIKVFGRSLASAKGLQRAGQCVVIGKVEGREYNGKYYTSVVAEEVFPVVGGESRQAQPGSHEAPHQVGAPSWAEDDIPF